MQQNDDARDLPPPQVRVISDFTEFERLQTAWTEIFASSAHAAPALDFDWLRQWWCAYDPQSAGGRLQVLTFWRGERLIGGLPLYTGQTNRTAFRLESLQFLSTGEAEHEETCPDYLNLLCRPGEESACLTAASRSIATLHWDTLHFTDISATSPLIELAQSLTGVGDCELLPRGQCPTADLSGGMSAYLQRLASDRRQKKKRLLRETIREDVQFDIATENDMTDYFADLVRLHQSRWKKEGKPGCFASPRFTEFHHSLCERWVPAGRAILARMSFAGRVVAVLYGFVNRGKFDYYQSGIDCDNVLPLTSPGIQAQLLLMQALCERGVTTFDFLRGESAYKRRLATGSNSLVSLHVWRKNVRTTICRSTLAVGRKLRHGVKSLLRS